ncbi:DUF1194 domain-containing protein [Oscillatoria sp. FACHB-1406]|uniref:DUF1194 domain-containing protein n=1 Tax=Oscillatoria sp. FACHB-1406 TaxID=2692846 RepID=UPI00168A3984|nr:DUF1194 domain-containing protein [Oscillatoria sp. FACHB-1406]MBD2579923.1 DUF1194 domain-containing protein [Oscillatoria sp. FACHB-1406]
MLNRTFFQPRLSKTLSSVAAISALGLTVATGVPAKASSMTSVNVELSLLVDISPSINSQEYALQMRGYQDAFTKLSPLFGSGKFGSVAVNLIQWAGGNSQEESIPWMLIDSQDSAVRFADAIGSLVRPNWFSTAPGSAIQFATPLFSSNEYEGKRWVIDVSGDGVENSGVSTSQARDAALAAGVSAINGLPINPNYLKDRGKSSLDIWYENNVQGGDGSFTLPAYGFEDVGRALEQKLRRELTVPPTEPPTSVPEPTTILGLVLMGGGFVGLKRRRSV